jgi:predicted KAP-like P-loop ATPase
METVEDTSISFNATEKTVDNDYVSDYPKEDPSEDKFNRSDFARIVANIISNRKDPKCIVIGIYGAWGEGKTTAMNFIQYELKNSSNVICIKFNPWRYKDENTLLRMYFNTLAESLGKSMESQKEKIGKILSNYAVLVSPISFNLLGLSISPGDTLKNLGEALSSNDLDSLKNKLSAILLEEEKRVVIFLDDIDRLDKNEIQSIFKLVKATADFDNTAYVLAFDYEMVAEALGEKYVGEGKEAGMKFLEKIIQLPIFLPKLNKQALEQYSIKGISRAIQEADIELTRDQMQEFYLNYTTGLSVRVNTPRNANLYENGLRYSLKILRNEVNIIDMMLIEGIRIYYSDLYVAIRDHPVVFLGSTSTKDIDKDSIKKTIDGYLEGYDPNERIAAINLLKHLFPRVNNIYGNYFYGSDWEITWANEQRIASQDYFNRYFMYSIPPGDLPDEKLEYLLEIILKNSVEDVAKLILQIIDDKQEKSFLGKIRRKIKKIPYNKIGALSRAFAQIGHKFSDSSNSIFDLAPIDRAAIFIRLLLMELPKGERFNIVKDVLDSSELPFAVVCSGWIGSSSEEPEDDRTLSPEEEKGIGNLLAKKIAEENKGIPIYVKYPRNSKDLFYFWSVFGSKTELKKHLEESILTDPHNAFKFLNCFISDSTELGTGKISRGSFHKKSFPAISAYLDPKVILDAFYLIHGNELKDIKQKSVEEVSQEEKVACQFEKIFIEMQGPSQD